LHGAGAVRPVEETGRDDTFRGIAGVTYTWGGLGYPWLNAVTLTMEYAREIVLRTVDPSILPPGGDESTLGSLLAFNVFRNTLVGHLLFKVSEEAQGKRLGKLEFERPVKTYTTVGVTL